MNFCCQHLNVYISALLDNSRIDRTTSKMLRNRVPKPKVCSIVVFNDQDVNGAWIPMWLEIDSWVTLQPASRGTWATDAYVHDKEFPTGA